MGQARKTEGEEECLSFKHLPASVPLPASLLFKGCLARLSYLKVLHLISYGGSPPPACCLTTASLFSKGCP